MQRTIHLTQVECLIAERHRAQAPAQSKETMMCFYNHVHRFYSGVDLHARTLAVCILDQAGAVERRQ
jgi:hypothetical protein